MNATEEKAPAQAPATPVSAAVPPAAPANLAGDAPAPAAPALTPEQQAKADADAVRLRENKAAAEILAICNKYDVNLIVGHSVNITARKQEDKN